ncbi:MAG: toll/interleukin-1 receptor domain-containing protein [Ginsengibacter sp.]
MGYIPGFNYDIFISYSHIDNEKVESGQGWVEQFYKALRISLWQLVGTEDVKIWWDDKRLDGGVMFDDAIAGGIKKSAILLCLNSPSYLNSQYCKKELDLFYNTAQYDSIGLKVDDRSRIINVLLNNISYSQWPAELSGTSGFRFHDVEGEDKEDDDKGHRLEPNTPPFKEQLKDLGDSLAKLIEILAKPKVVIPEFSIYFADVTDTLSNVRKRTIIELEKEGFNIISGLPPPYEEDQHEIAVKEKLKESALAVHLLNQYPGKEIEVEDAMWYPQKQVELSLQFSKQQLIWVPKELDINLIEEEPYKTFMQGLDSGKQVPNKIEYIRGTKSELPQQIKTLAEQLKKQLLQPASGKLSVLLDTHYNDQMYALELSKSLLENQIQPFINPQDDDPRKNINILEDRISQVNKLVFFYGNVAAEWVSERMKAALQLILSNQYPVKDFFVFMLPPHKDPNDKIAQQQFKVSVVNNSDAIQLDTETLALLLKSLKAAA